MLHLHEFFKGFGAEIVRRWPTDGYTFDLSAAIVDGCFVGLVIDTRTQGMITNKRIDTWLETVKPLLLEGMHTSA